MTTKNLITALTIILILAIGITLVNVFIYIGCHILLAMMINPIGAAIILAIITTLLFIADALYKKYKK